MRQVISLGVITLLVSFSSMGQNPTLSNLQLLGSDEHLFDGGSYKVGIDSCSIQVRVEITDQNLLKEILGKGAALILRAGSCLKAQLDYPIGVSNLRVPHRKKKDVDKTEVLDDLKNTAYLKRIIRKRKTKIDLRKIRVGVDARFFITSENLAVFFYKIPVRSIRENLKEAEILFFVRAAKTFSRPAKQHYNRRRTRGNTAATVKVGSKRKKLFELRLEDN